MEMVDSSVEEDSGLVIQRDSFFLQALNSASALFRFPSTFSRALESQTRSINHTGHGAVAVC